MFKQEKQVSYSQVDCKWRLSPVSVLNFFQDIATDASASVYPIDELARDGYAWLVISTRFQVKRYPGYGEKITVATFPKSFCKIFAERGYEIYDSTGEVIIKGSSLWLLYDVKKQKAAMIGEAVSSRYTVEDADMLPVIRRDIKKPDDIEVIKEFAVQKRDLDSNYHVNNAKYIEFALETVDDEKEIEELEIYYRHAAKLGEKLTLGTAVSDGKTMCEIKKDSGETCVTMRFKQR